MANFLSMKSTIGKPSALDRNKECKLSEGDFLRQNQPTSDLEEIALLD
jgi:hypothetical protein